MKASLTGLMVWFLTKPTTPAYWPILSPVSLSKTADRSELKQLTCSCVQNVQYSIVSFSNTEKYRSAGVITSDDCVSECRLVGWRGHTRHSSPIDRLRAPLLHSQSSELQSLRYHQGPISISCRLRASDTRPTLMPVRNLGILTSMTLNPVSIAQDM